MSSTVILFHFQVFHCVHFECPAIPQATCASAPVVAPPPTRPPIQSSDGPAPGPGVPAHAQQVGGSSASSASSSSSSREPAQGQGQGALAPSGYNSSTQSVSGSLMGGIGGQQAQQVIMRFPLLAHSAKVVQCTFQCCPILQESYLRALKHVSFSSQAEADEIHFYSPRVHVLKLFIVWLKHRTFEVLKFANILASLLYEICDL